MRLILASAAVLACGCGFHPGSQLSVDGSVDGAIDAMLAPAVRVNLKGQAHDGTDYPGTWARDLGTCPAAGTYTKTGDINGTADDALFEVEAFDDVLDCSVPNLPAGTYDVTLLFAEIYQGTACGHSTTSRTFSIALEDSVVEPSFDLFAEGGGCALSGGTGHPVARTFSVAVTDGTLDLRLTRATGSDYAVLSALQVVQTSAM